MRLYDKRIIERVKQEFKKPPPGIWRMSQSLTPQERFPTEERGKLDEDKYQEQRVYAEQDDRWLKRA